MQVIQEKTNIAKIILDFGPDDFFRIGDNVTFTFGLKPEPEFPKSLYGLEVGYIIYHPGFVTIPNQDGVPNGKLLFPSGPSDLELRTFSHEFKATKPFELGGSINLLFHYGLMALAVFNLKVEKQGEIYKFKDYQNPGRYTF